MTVMVTTGKRRCQILNFGSWPLREALPKSVDSWLSSLARLGLPLDVADWAAVWRLPAIRRVTWWYWDGFACSICSDAHTLLVAVGGP